jgi:hypothetical protein
MQALRLTLLKINDCIPEKLPISLTTFTYPYKPEDAIWVKEWDEQPLIHHWRGTFVVILFTYTAVKVAEIAPWIHHSQVKLASLKWECIPVQPHHASSPSKTPTLFLGRAFQNLWLSLGSESHSGS